MHSGICRLALAAAACLLLSRLAVARQIDFQAEIAPLFQRHCLKCHGPTKQKGGLRLDARSGAVRAGDSGEKAIASGNAEASELIRRVTSDDEFSRMPPEGDRLTRAEIDVLKRWIDGGAVWPESPVHAPEARELIVTEDDRQHWSFRPLRLPPVPAVKSPDLARTPIDAFILAALDDRGLLPAKPAAPRKLIRRIKLDLLGLPPTPAEIAEFEAASASGAEAIESLVDRLLGSPQYGERWGRHWLDIARYADSNGQEQDADRPFAYQYRDFVIRAFNDDLPFDTFVRWQIAGDELEPDKPLAVAATGFLAAGPFTGLADTRLEEERLRNRYDELDNILSTFGNALLGLTVGCARCHDHKYDAVPARDYYRLMSAFHAGERQDVLLGARPEVAAFQQVYAEWQLREREAQEQLRAWLQGERQRLEPKLRAAKIAALDIPAADKEMLLNPPGTAEAKNSARKYQKQLAVSDEELESGLAPEQQERGARLKEQLRQIQQAKPATLPRAFAWRDLAPDPRPTWLFRRGDFFERSEPVELGFLTVLTNSKSAAQYWDEARFQGTKLASTFQRAAIANWLTDFEQGAASLLARVIVNRVWQHHFGEGLARTPNDFGVQGERPTHPELLEWLAWDFVAHGWRLKRLHRQIVSSAVYQQDTTFDAAQARVDPDNRLLWRRRPSRLEAEALRDTMLHVAGTLNFEAYGPGFKPQIPAEAMAAYNLAAPYVAEPADSSRLRRRSVYMFHKRVVPYPLLQIFDRPDALQSCGRRETTLVAPQALSLLNDSFVRERSVEFADRLMREESGLAAQTRAAFEAALGRLPTVEEQGAADDFITTRWEHRRQRTADQNEQTSLRAALADYCQALFGLNEFLYVD